MDDKFTTVEQAHKQQLLNGNYLVWTNQYTRQAYTVLSIKPLQASGGFKLLLGGGNLEIAPGTDELTIMPPHKQVER